MDNQIKLACSSDNYLSLAEMEPFEDNPRELTDAGFKKLKKSILELGVFKPFLIWKEGNKVLGGNQRFRVIEHLVNEEGFNADKLPVTYLDVEEKVARTIVLRDNQSDGDWAYELLADYIENLEKLGADISLTGFSDKEHQDLQKLVESPTELRDRLESMAAGTSLDDDIAKAFGISFKVPDEDLNMYNEMMAVAKERTKTKDVWTNLKCIFNHCIFDGSEKSVLGEEIND
jgi:ParB-like chromosome segregation protein Spo0J